MIPGVRNGNTRRVVHRAVAAGWVFAGVTRGGHGKLRWPPTGDVVLFNLSRGGDRNAWKNTARRIEQLSGVTVRTRAKHGRGRGGRRRSPPEPARVKRDRERFTAEAEQRAADRRRRFIASLMQPG